MTLTMTVTGPKTQRLTCDENDRWVDVTLRDRRSVPLERSDGTRCGGEFSRDFGERWMIDRIMDGQ